MIVSINIPEYICGKKSVKKNIFVKKILRKLFFEIEKNPPSLKKSYSGYNKISFFSTFLIKKKNIRKIRFKNAYKKKLYLKKL